MAKRGSDIAGFLRRIDHLADAVGHGVLETGITMNQRYARYQHEDPTLAHPQGGKDHFLTDPLYARSGQMVGALADAAITRDGSRLTEEATVQAEEWAAASVAQTPKEWGDLANSHAPYVLDNGEAAYERPPKARRLTDAELALKSRWGASRSRGRR